MNYLLFGALLLLALILPVAGALFNRYHWRQIRSEWEPGWRSALRAMFRGLALEDLGAVTVNYFIRAVGVSINGSTTAPTATQARQTYMQKAQVIMGDTDTQALFTHNWGLDLSAPTYFDPEIFYELQLGTAGSTYLTGFTFDKTNTNVVKINKLNFLGTGGTFLFTLRQPHSLGQ